jgi:hypothetical protein
MRTEIQLLSKLRVTVEFSIQRAEPDVGIMAAYVDDWIITEVNGSVPSNLNWLYGWIDITEGATTRIEDACMQAAIDYHTAEEYFYGVP